jgi:hypothetical protein
MGKTMKFKKNFYVLLQKNILFGTLVGHYFVHVISPKICYRTLSSKKFKILIEETQQEEW